MTLPAAAVPATSAGMLFAQQQPGGQGADFGKSSPVGLLLLLMFLVAVAFLVRSMTKHLKRLPASFDADRDEPERTGDGAEDTLPGRDDAPGRDAEADTAATARRSDAGADRSAVNGTASDAPS